MKHFARNKDFVLILQEISFLVQDLQDSYIQDLMQDIANLARKIFARLAYSLQDGFYWKGILMVIFSCYYKISIYKSLILSIAVIVIDYSKLQYT